ncbi:MAG TPA: ABC transporter ATP-binding protein [Candidatus Faecousia intestinavium]|nr:ABC transporter ATP-binding protein [Candidatus Faecousia intestinavium]
MAEKDKDVVLSVKDLHVYFYTNQRCNKVLRGISFDIRRGRTLCVVGESGCGKSVTANSILRLLPDLSRIESGSITYYKEDGTEIRLDQLEKNGKQMRKLRGEDIAIIFQDPMTALNPVFTVGYQIEEMLREHKKDMTNAEYKMAAIEDLADMGIPSPEIRYGEYPHQFSGGMRQRSMIAMGMSCNPKILLADEPTTALDVTISAQIFDLMNNLKKEHNTAIMMITHNMGVVAEMADEVAVMYMGNIVEYGPVEQIFTNPAHPYTKALLQSIPVLGKGKNQQLEPIRGSTPDPFNRPKGCQFCPRCDYACQRCEEEMPPEEWVSESHYTRCFNYKEVMTSGK